MEQGKRRRLYNHEYGCGTNQTLTYCYIYKHRLRIAECLREDILELIEVYETQIQVEQEATKKLMDMINRHIDRDVKEYKEKNNYPIKRKR